MFRWLLGGICLVALVVNVDGAATGTGKWKPVRTSVSADAAGWAFHPTIAAGTDRALYMAWSQHRNPAIWEVTGIYARRWSNGEWKPLGGRIGHMRAPEGQGAKWAHAYAPVLAVLGGTPYIAWYEGGGYGWGALGGVDFGSSVFVAHWDGTRWKEDDNTDQANGALNTAVGHKETGKMPSGRDPKLTVVRGLLYAAWIETRTMVDSGISYNVIVVKHLRDRRWIQDGPDVRVGADVAEGAIIDLALADVGGTPWLAWTELTRQSGNRPATLQAVKFSGTDWTQVGEELSISRQGYANYIAMAAVAEAPYIAWQERTIEGMNQIYVKHWDGARWAGASSSLNADRATGEAGRPALAGDGRHLWLAWTEGRPGERSKLYVRALTSSGWSDPDGPLNADDRTGAADTPALALSGQQPSIVWAEKGAPPETKQLYVRSLE